MEKKDFDFGTELYIVLKRFVESNQGKQVDDSEIRRLVGRAKFILQNHDKIKRREYKDKIGRDLVREIKFIKSQRPKGIGRDEFWVKEGFRKAVGMFRKVTERYEPQEDKVTRGKARLGTKLANKKKQLVRFTE